MPSPATDAVAMVATAVAEGITARGLLTPSPRLMPSPATDAVAMVATAVAEGTTARERLTPSPRLRLSPAMAVMAMEDAAMDATARGRPSPATEPAATLIHQPSATDIYQGWTEKQ